MSLHEPITEAAALRRFPELAELVEIRRAGWDFHRLHDENGDLLGIAASHSKQRYTDAVFLFDRAHFVGCRTVTDEDDGGVVWLKEGKDLQEIVRELVDLPAPGEPGAPALIIRASALWTP
ncbi:hypothetical protein [Actinokineospora sp.]|uniref:hypothetical protein n=1 Tax=Actinokineospora sp. TaxID=1872133 RepID=UPI004037A533